MHYFCALSSIFMVPDLKNRIKIDFSILMQNCMKIHISSIYIYIYTYIIKEILKKSFIFFRGGCVCRAPRPRNSYRIALRRDADFYRCFALQSTRGCAHSLRMFWIKFHVNLDPCFL